MSYEILTVALAQTSSVPGDVAANAGAAALAIKDAAASGASLVMFPELSLIGYDLDLLRDPGAWVSEDDPRLDVVRGAVRDGGLTAVAGAAYRHPDGTAWLASLAFSADGQVRVHGKCHLHGRERELFRAAGPGAPLDVDGWRVALAICYDAGVPGHAEDAARRGAEVYAGSALYTLEETRRIDLHFGARAMDHRMFAVVANHAGSGPGWVSCGGSGAWHPDGTRLTQAATGPGVFTAVLSRAEMAGLREKDARAGYPRAAG
ncbi:carbon-nitrogen hydrolase family protein [Nonomuraea sp. NPDC050394]|uniref:carbon-nitrogen hydrolase family protein n=1 Tax=Nonomuraea sp. NPDC050394 TaxID=3364363 RepID=UPI0037A67CAC